MLLSMLLTMFLEMLLMADCPEIETVSESLQNQKSPIQTQTQSQSQRYLQSPRKLAQVSVVQL